MPTNFGHQPFLGAYSEQFYGPNAVMLVQHNADIMSSTQHKSYQLHDNVTGEKRFCLKDIPAFSEIPSSSNKRCYSVITKTPTNL